MEEEEGRTEEPPAGPDGGVGLLIQVRGLRVRVAGRPVLRGLDLDLGEGVLALLEGPNGAGKSTLLRTLAGFLRPSKGEISWFGKDSLRGRPELRARIGYVGHEAQVYEDLSAYENLFLFAGLYGLSSPHRRVNAALEAASLWDRRDDAPRKYSRGMRTRLALARAVLHNPSLLLLDEPETGLDESGLDWLRALLRGLLARGGSALLVSHAAERYAGLGPRSLRLAGGQLA